MSRRKKEANENLVPLGPKQKAWIDRKHFTGISENEGNADAESSSIIDALDALNILHDKRIIKRIDYFSKELNSGNLSLERLYELQELAGKLIYAYEYAGDIAILDAALSKYIKVLTGIKVVIDDRIIKQREREENSIQHMESDKASKKENSNSTISNDTHSPVVRGIMIENYLKDNNSERIAECPAKKIPVIKKRQIIQIFDNYKGKTAGKILPFLVALADIGMLEESFLGTHDGVPGEEYKTVHEALVNSLNIKTDYDATRKAIPNHKDPDQSVTSAINAARKAIYVAVNNMNGG